MLKEHSKTWQMKVKFMIISIAYSGNLSDFIIKMVL